MADLLEPDVALTRVLAAVPPAQTVKLPTAECLGLMLAEDALAAADLPPFDRAMMDGYAVRLADAGQHVTALEEIAAGDGKPRTQLQPGHVYPIMTGARVATGAEAVVAVEQTTRIGDQVHLPERIRPGSNIALRGSECLAGRAWARAGSPVTPMTLAAALSVGALHLTVHPRPQIAVIATGSELAAMPNGPGRIRDSNGPMLVALLHEADLPARNQVVMDDADALFVALQSLATCDAIVLTGGVSAGTHDEVPDVLRRLGAEVLFHKVAQRPGKPLLVARIAQQLVFALPGNPLAAHLCACRYVIPALRRLAGLPHAPLNGIGTLCAPLPPNTDRTWFLPAQVHAGLVTPLPPVSSADLVQPHQANAYLCLKPGAPAVPAGTDVSYTRIGVNVWAI